MSESKTNEWEFEVDDIIASKDPHDVSPQHDRVKKRLTDEDGKRFYHLTIRLKNANGWTESYGNRLAPAEEIDSVYRVVDEADR